MSVIMYKEGKKYEVETEHFMGNDVQGGWVNGNYYEYWTPPGTATFSVKMISTSQASSSGNMGYDSYTGEITVVDVSKVLTTDGTVNTVGSSSSSKSTTTGIAISWTVGSYPSLTQTGRNTIYHFIQIRPQGSTLELMGDLTKWECWYKLDNYSSTISGSASGIKGSLSVNEKLIIGNPGVWTKIGVYNNNWSTTVTDYWANGSSNKEWNRSDLAKATIGRGITFKATGGVISIKFVYIGD